MKKLKLWLLSQSTNNGYDTYDAVVIVAYNEESAVKESFLKLGKRVWTDNENDVTVEYLGVYEGKETTEGVILGSFNAG